MIIYYFIKLLFYKMVKSDQFIIEFMNQKMHCQNYEIDLGAHQSHIQILIFYDKSLQPDGVDL